MYHSNIRRDTLKNTDYRRVIYTVPDSFQLVYMSIPKGQTIHTEVHPTTTQFIRIEQGLGIATLHVASNSPKLGFDIATCNVTPNSHTREYALTDDTAIVIPPNTIHKIENIGNKPLKLYTIYTPPEHPVGLVQHKNPDI